MNFQEKTNELKIKIKGGFELIKDDIPENTNVLYLFSGVIDKNLKVILL